mmetsp:Transcript_22625/g.67879  ORF Transcript_22625/g.67879 Transcript_22625/m.67879 type:complete len:473 (-) Transcript_22625:45-1463(-)
MPSLAFAAVLCAVANGFVASRPARSVQLKASVEAFVTEKAPELLDELVKAHTELGVQMKQANARTGGSAVLESVVLESLDAKGLKFRCSVKRRLGGLGRNFETTDETAEAAWTDIDANEKAGSAIDGATAQRRLMQAACKLGLSRAAAELLDAEFPGGLGDAGALPDNLWLNNVPASKLARSHMAEACIAAVLDALGDPDAPPTLKVNVKPPELDVEMDTYRVGTLLELVRSLAFRIIDGTGRRVRICVQAPMGEGIFAGMPLSLNGVRKLLELMDWGGQEVGGEDDMIRFGAINAQSVDKKDEVFLLIAPQSIVGSSIVPLLAEMVDAAAGRPIVTINARLDDIQSSAGVMSYRGRADRLDFVDAWQEAFHFSLVVPPGRTFFPILGAVCRPLLGAPYALYQREEFSRVKNQRFADSRARYAAAKAGELIEKYVPIGCFEDMPDAKVQKLAFREEAKRLTGVTEKRYGKLR